MPTNDLSRSRTCPIVSVQRQSGLVLAGPTLRDAAASRAASCLYGLAAVGLVWVLMFAASFAAAQDPGPRHWNRQAASALLAYIDDFDRHGLDPDDYAPAELLQGIESGDPQVLENRATAASGWLLSIWRPGTSALAAGAATTSSPTRWRRTRLRC